MTTTMPKRGEGGLGSDPQAPEWHRLYHEHVPRIRRIAAYRVGPNLAEDVVQDTLLRAYRNRHSFDSSRSERGWINAIASRSSIDALRHKLASVEDLLGNAVDHQAAPDNGEEEFFNAVRRQGIDEALSGLNERHRKVLELVIIDGWSHEQVAAAMGINAGAVKSLLARARATFKERYTEFSEKSGVFGAGAVGTAIWRIRMRIHRFVERHAGMVTTAMVTVASVGVAAVPTTQLLLPTEAIEPAVAVSTPATEDTGGGDPSSGTQAEASVSTSSDGATATTSGGADSSSVAPATSASGRVQIETETTIGRNGSGAEVGVTATTDGPQDDGTLTGGISSSDCSGMVTGAFCVVVETAEDASPPPTE